MITTQPSYEPYQIAIVQTIPNNPAPTALFQTGACLAPFTVHYKLPDGPQMVSPAILWKGHYMPVALFPDLLDVISPLDPDRTSRLIESFLPIVRDRLTRLDKCLLKTSCNASQLLTIQVVIDPAQEYNLSKEIEELNQQFGQPLAGLSWSIETDRAPFTYVKKTRAYLPVKTTRQPLVEYVRCEFEDYGIQYTCFVDASRLLLTRTCDETRLLEVIVNKVDRNQASIQIAALDPHHHPTYLVATVKFSSLIFR